MIKVMMFSGCSMLMMESAFSADRDILWNRVHDQCLPAFTATGIYAPCALVDKQGGYVYYKADGDEYQYLLMPTTRVTGIEDSLLQKPDAPPYLYDAWGARALVAAMGERPVSERDIGMTVNPPNARSQDHLHIHVSCIAADVRNALDRLDREQLDGKWRAMPEELKGHLYHFRSLSLKELRQDNPFVLAGRKAAGDGKSMYVTSLAVVPVDEMRFVLLTAYGQPSHPVPAETLQDHSCSIAGGATVSPL
jgi:CDP-diacylglycerol pyrophosphatase